MSPRPRSLQRRTWLGVLTAVVAVWLVSAVVTWVDTRHELAELLDAHLAQAASLLVVQQAHQESADGDGDDGGAQGTDAPTLHRYASQVAFQIFHEGRLVQRSSNAPTVPLSALVGGPATPAVQGFFNVQHQGQSWRVFGSRGAHSDVQVYVGEATASRMAILWAVMRSALWPMLVALPVLGLAMAWSIRRSLAPLRRLSDTLAQRQPQALEPLALPHAPPELQTVADALNRLLGRIQALVAAERRFTADAAHELRTPIAAIRTQAQVALSEPDPAAREHALKSTLLGCDRASHLVEQLLTLARLDAASQATASAMPLVPVNLSQVAQRAVAEAAPESLRRQQDLALDAAPAAWVAGVEALLAVLLRNLIDNALRYSPTGAHIAVSVQVSAQAVLLQVQDSGPGLTEAECQRLGERFFRASTAATSDATGSGLGWSIVTRIAAAHGFELSAGRSEQLGGFRVSLKCPSVPAPGVSRA